MREAGESFRVAPKREQPYIEPNFAKVEFDGEKPAVLLIFGMSPSNGVKALSMKSLRSV
jgi:hypothetical protein